MKACNDVDFLANYWIEAKKIGAKIRKELPGESIIDSKHLKKVNSESPIKMFLVNYKDLGDNWSVDHIISKNGGRSKTLEILADKINHMIILGRGNDVKPMIEKICTGRIKKLSRIINASKDQKTMGSVYLNNYLGHGHFRWNYKAHTLTIHEIKRLKQYFKL